MKLLTKLISFLVFGLSFLAALYLGYRLFAGSTEDAEYSFGDSLYREGDDQDLYQNEEVPPEEEAPFGEGIEEARVASSMIH